MSHRKDTEYLSISARVRAMETRLLTRDRLERMIDARDDAEALKVLSECGYADMNELTAPALEQMLSAARTQLFRELAGAMADPRLVELFQVKYDYHNAKVLVKAGTGDRRMAELMISGGRYAPEQIGTDMSGCTPQFLRAVEQAQQCLEQTSDPQMADILLDRACYAEMGQLARASENEFLQGYVCLMVDAANLRTCVRCARLEKDSDFMAMVLMEGGSVCVSDLVRSRGQNLSSLFRSDGLEEAARLADSLAKPGAGPLTAFERECDNAIMAYQERARRIPFGPEVAAAYLFAKEAELTAVRTVMAGRMAGLDGDVIRQRLRRTYV